MDASFWSGLQFWIPLVVPVNTDVIKVRPVPLSLESLFEAFGKRCFWDYGIFFLNIVHQAELIWILWAGVYFMEWLMDMVRSLVNFYSQLWSCMVCLGDDNGNNKLLDPSLGGFYLCGSVRGSPVSDTYWMSGLCMVCFE